MIPGVTIAIPGIAKRGPLITRAVASVMRQTEPVAAIVTVIDRERKGASWNRNRAIAMVDTEWTGFLDDDDVLYPWHCERLLELAGRTGAGLVHGWYDVSGGHDPMPENRGRVYSEADPFTVPITYLVRTEVLHQAVAETGGFQDDPELTGSWNVQDEPLFAACVRLGGIAVTPDATWLWHHHGANTSGLSISNLERHERGELVPQ